MQRYPGVAFLFAAAVVPAVAAAKTPEQRIGPACQYSGLQVSFGPQSFQAAYC